MKETAIVTGASGQDGAYLAELLLAQGIKVYGAARRASTKNYWRMQELGIADLVEFVDFDLHEYSNILELIRALKPTYLFNLGAQSFVGTSFRQPLLTTDVDAVGVTRILEALRLFSPETRFYQASTSEMFGKVQTVPQSEGTPFYPRSPYGVAKLYSHWITVNYREAYGIHGSSGILFNHESPFRGLEFVTRKITSTFARIKNGSGEILELGNLDAKRDWGHARDYVQGMFAMTQAKHGNDYVLATGVTRTVREFVGYAAEALGMTLEFSGSGVEETAREKSNGKLLLRINPKHFRPSEVELLVGDASKAEQELGWKASTTLDKLVEEMARTDFDRLRRGITLV
ncbi:MAG: GDP-mannose 4,6-dehydratase [Bdellovibrionales bacterium]|nr:GDP-mannose 4,6-dehydratase [Bdellovibrionales bacterium]